ncbi:hypothetical protein IJJ12_00140 [bacterium]|nr:hypothetical protein [bacterium]
MLLIKRAQAATLGGDAAGSTIKSSSQWVSGETIAWGKIIGSITTFLFSAASVLCLIFLIWGGIEMITSGGDKGKFDHGRGRMSSAVIGLLTVACSWAIWSLVMRLLGVDTSSGGVDFGI